MGRTELVKLVYLCDNRFHESTGRTITGNTYMWDNFGPNAVSHAIVNEADQLVNHGSLRMAVRQSMYAGIAYEYWIDDPSATWRDVEGTLGPGECQVLMDVAKTFGRRSLRSLIEASKQTRPFTNAEQYQLLELEQVERAKRTRKMLESSGEFLEDAEMGLQDAEAGNWIWDDDLDAVTTS